MYSKPNYFAIKHITIFNHSHNLAKKRSLIFTNQGKVKTRKAKFFHSLCGIKVKNGKKNNNLPCKYGKINYYLPILLTYSCYRQKIFKQPLANSTKIIQQAEIAC